MKILIWAENKNGGPYDVGRTIDYKDFFSEFQKNYHANTYNVGNKVWIQGILSALSTEDNELFFLSPDDTWEEINSKYDRIVYSAANMLSGYYLDLIDRMSEIFSKSRIPVFVIAIGAQATSYDEIDSLVQETKQSVSKFMETIYRTGGEIACRGYFTKEYLDRIAHNTAVATGCPSVFQNGRDLLITKSNNPIKPVLNGNAPFADLEKQYPSSVYIDQDFWLRYKYDLDSGDSKKSLMSMILEEGKTKTELFLQGRIQVFADIADWKRFLENEEFTFSVGSRLHGNIMSVLCGIPACFYPVDSRTREVAEFFHFPMMTSCKEYYDLDDLYEKTDYDRFNRYYGALFDGYESFLQKCGLVKRINRDNPFWQKESPKNSDIITEKRNGLLNAYSNPGLFGRILFSTAGRYPTLFGDRYRSRQTYSAEDYSDKLK